MTNLRRRTKRERLSFLEGWLLGLQFALDNATANDEKAELRVLKRVEHIRSELEKVRKVIH